VTTIAHDVGRPAKRRLLRDRTARRWLLAWAGACGIGIANAVVRETAIAPFVSEPQANRLSVATLVVLIGLYVWVLDRRWPIASTRAAVAIGGAWAVLTVLFELTFGHWVAGDTWTELARNHEVWEGRLWPVAVAWILVAPALVRAIRVRRG
jgi:hypothetical protein